MTVTVCTSGPHYGKSECTNPVKRHFNKWVPFPKDIKHDVTTVKCCPEFNGEMDRVEMPDGIHHAKLVCPFCGTYKKWEENPNVTADMNRRDVTIDRLLTEYRKQLTDYNVAFLVNIKGRRHLTPPQMERYLKLKNGAQSFREMVANYSGDCRKILNEMLEAQKVAKEKSDELNRKYDYICERMAMMKGLN